MTRQQTKEQRKDEAEQRCKRNAGVTKQREKKLLLHANLVASTFGAFYMLHSVCGPLLVPRTSRNGVHDLHFLSITACCIVLRIVMSEGYVFMLA